MHRVKFLLISALAVAGMSLSGCIMIRSSSISDSVGKGGTAVTGTASDMGYLWLIPPQNLTQNAASQLVGGCSTGKLNDVVTEMNVRDFLGIVQMYEVDATGVCS
jgi:hypothetical protein